MERTIRYEMLTMAAYVNFIICIFCITAASALPSKEGCDKSKCEGPLQYYEDLGCKPIYRKPEDCCPYKYNCDTLKNRSPDKCHINGKDYAIGEMLKDEDANPCDVGCKCLEQQGVATFMCAIVDCFHGPMNPDCYRTKNATDCCDTEVCPEKPGDIPKCEVDGKTYEAGQYFSPSAEPNMDCYCSEGFKGEFTAPWCKVRAHSSCGVELRRAYEIHNKCAPTYYHGQSPQTDCAVAYRCQNAKDEVIKHDSSENKSADSADDIKCKFGNLEMQLGDELNQATDYSSVCVKCTCDVPPIPTCRHLPDSECDVTNHPPFE